MTRDDLARMSRDELIDLALADYAQLQALQAEIEALRMKLEKSKKPPIGHVKYERKMVADPDHIVEVKPQVCKDCQTDLRETKGQLAGVNQSDETSSRVNGQNWWEWVFYSANAVLHVIRSNCSLEGRLAFHYHSISVWYLLTSPSCWGVSRSPHIWYASLH